MLHLPHLGPDLMLICCLLLLAATPRVTGTYAVYDGGAGCSGYGFQLNSFWLDCGESELCQLEDGSMKIQGSFSTKYKMPFAYYTVKIKACKWWGMKCIDLPEQFEVDLCEVINCEAGNHTIEEQEIILYGQEEDKFDYWQYNYGYDYGADDEERYQGQYQKYQQDQQEAEEAEYYETEEEDPDVDQYGKRKYNNWWRNKWWWKKSWRQQQDGKNGDDGDDAYYGYTSNRRYYQQKQADGDDYLSGFASVGTKVSLKFTFTPYTDATYGEYYGRTYWSYDLNKSADERCNNQNDDDDEYYEEDEACNDENAEEEGEEEEANENGNYYDNEYDEDEEMEDEEYDPYAKYENWTAYNRSHDLDRQRYGRRYWADTIKCTLPIKIVSEDFDVELWQQSSRYRNRRRIFWEAFTGEPYEYAGYAVSMVGLLCLSAWGLRKRRLACCECQEANDFGDSIEEDDDDIKATGFVLAGSTASDPKFAQPP